MENFALAMSRFRRNKFDDCIILCDELLKTNSNDLAVQLLKTHAIRRKNYVDHLEFDEETIGEMILDEHVITHAPRPGTSLRAGTSAKGMSPLIRPVTSSGRALSGVVRAETGKRQGTASNVSIIRQQTGRAGTSRATTSGGRYLRIATASLQSLNSSLSLNISDINPKNIVKKRSLARAVADYLFYVEKNFKKLLEICSEATIVANYSDWWWKYQLGKVYYKLGMLQDSEKQLLSAFKQFSNYSNITLQLCHLYIKMDQPMKALEVLNKGIQDNPGEMYFKIYQARIHEMLNDYEMSIGLYKDVLILDNCNFEAIACIGSHHFYSDQPEIALKFYKRLFELGINSSEIWNNLGLCAYYSGQYDLCLSCFEKALMLADDTSSADIWYNISHMAIGIGDLPLAYQALKIAIGYNGDHFEAFNNIGVLEIKKGNYEQAKSNFLLACKSTDFTFEPYYNYAAMRYKQGDKEESLKFAKKSIEIFPDHFESKELVDKISKALLD
jgi:tetratricopeptide repeat protein 8